MPASPEAYWTKEEEAVLYEMYEGAPDLGTVAKALGYRRSVDAIEQHAARLFLRRTRRATRQSYNRSGMSWDELKSIPKGHIPPSLVEPFYVFLKVIQSGGSIKNCLRRIIEGPVDPRKRVHNYAKGVSKDA